MPLTIKTNNVPRDVLYVLSEKERKEFDYLDWSAIDEGSDSASFFRYNGQVYDLGEFMRIPEGSELGEWQGYSSDTYFSGLVVKYTNDNESVIVGRYFN